MSLNIMTNNKWYKEIRRGAYVTIITAGATMAFLGQISWEMFISGMVFSFFAIPVIQFIISIWWGD